MKLPEPYVCDECGQKKSESNHWFMALPAGLTADDDTIIPDSLSALVELIGKGLQANLASTNIQAFILVRWLPSIADDAGVKHLCSESCSTKALSKWCSTG